MSPTRYGYCVSRLLPRLLGAQYLDISPIFLINFARRWTGGSRRTATRCKWTS
jgi:hypothetical protein